MTASHTKLIEDLIREEGFRPHAYQDHLGYWTIGYGRQVDVRLGGGITEKEARMLLENDVLCIGPELDAAMPWWRTLPESQARALCHMAFQLGVPRLKQFKRMLGHLKNGDFVFAADEALNSKWATQTPARAQRVADLMRTPAPDS